MRYLFIIIAACVGLVSCQDAKFDASNDRTRSSVQNPSTNGQQPPPTNGTQYPNQPGIDLQIPTGFDNPFKMGVDLSFGLWRFWSIGDDGDNGSSCGARVGNAKARGDVYNFTFQVTVRGTSVDISFSHCGVDRHFGQSGNRGFASIQGPGGSYGDLQLKDSDNKVLGVTKFVTEQFQRVTLDVGTYYVQTVAGDSYYAENGQPHMREDANGNMVPFRDVDDFMVGNVKLRNIQVPNPGVDSPKNAIIIGNATAVATDRLRQP